MEIINQLAKAKNKTASIALRINPNVKADTHSYITTGIAENKFGINIADLEKVLGITQELSNVTLIGLHFHIGSQIYFQQYLLKETLTTLCNETKKHAIRAHYAVKANANKKILSIITNYGLGADCVSGNEIKTALQAGFPASKVVFAG